MWNMARDQEVGVGIFLATKERERTSKQICGLEIHNDVKNGHEQIDWAKLAVAPISTIYCVMKYLGDLMRDVILKAATYFNSLLDLSILPQ